MPPMLMGIGSDDEDDEDDGPGLTLPPGIAGMSMPTPPPKLTVGDPMASSSAAIDKNAFLLSQSGAFKMADFHIRPEGGLTLTAVGEENVKSPVRPSELTGFDAAAPPKLAVGSLSDLESLEVLGSGASATVYKARHKASGTLVAVKQVTILEKAKRDQVVSELRIMMSHVAGAGYLVGMHNAFYEEAKVYTVLELMDQGSIEDLVARHASAGGLSDETELARVARQLLGGLNYLHHQLHQVHRDLKPANVMMNSEGAVKISDFGISSQLENTAGLCETFVGTTCYMSPERLSGEAYSYAADIWAFGLILLELASGKYPYANTGSYFDLLGTIMDQPPPELPEGKDFSDDLASLIGLCLDKEPSMRPSARDLLQHPWFKKHEQLRLSAQRSATSVGSNASIDSESSRKDERRNFERSRSNMRDLEVSGLLAGMSLADMAAAAASAADDDDGPVR